MSAQIESVYARDKNFELHVTYKVIKFSLLSSPASSPPGWCLSLTWLDFFLLPCWWDMGEYSVMPKNTCLRSWQGCQKQIAKSGVQYTLITISLSYMYHCLSHNYYFLIYCFLFRPPSGADPGQVHMKYDAVRLQDYEFKITK